MPFAADAAGLGKMTVMSGLGEPLNAEIDISASKEELSSLSARIAPSETYAEQGVERPSSLTGVRIALGKKPDGTPVLKLSTQQPVNDPFLDMLIQVDWPTGRLLREYTALLDPPGYGERAADSAEAAATAAQPPLIQVPSKKNASKSGLAPASGVRGGADTSGKSAPPDSYLTKRGDTLRNVARKLQVEDVTLEQMLVGLYRSNRQAFIGDNMNQLKSGQIIRAPREEELLAVTPQQALEEVRMHTANWNAYRTGLADAVAKSATAQAESQPQMAAGKITASAEDTAAPPAAGPRDVVKLSKSDVSAAKGAAGGDQSGATSDKLRALEEESTAQERSIAEVNERIGLLEKQIQDMQKLLQVQNQLLAELQQGKPAPAAQSPAAPAEPTAAQPPAAAAPAPATPPAETYAEPGLLDSLTENPMLLPAAGGLLVLLGGTWLYLRNKRKKSLDSFEKGLLTSSGLKSDTVFGNTQGAAVNTGETSFLSDFAHRGGAGMIDTSDVDPISEAEVYMAYGRDAQAEEILKDAIAKEPKRYELHLKLLEIYANRKDKVAFETLAGELYAALGATNPVWLKVAELGRTLEPGNPLYAAAAEPEAAQDKATPSAVAGAAAVAATAAAASLDIPLGAAESGAEEAAAQDNALDFDLGMLAGEETEAVQGAGAGDAGLSWQEFGAAESTPATADASQAEESVPDLEFELPEPAADENAQLSAAEIGLSAQEEAQPEGAALEFPGLDAGLAQAEGVAEEAEPAPLFETAAEEPAPLPELPELPATAPASEAVEEISFDLPELAAPDAFPAVAEPGLPPPAADEFSAGAAPEMPAAPSEPMDSVFDFPASTESIELTAAPEEESAALELPEIGSPEQTGALAPEAAFAQGEADIGVPQDAGSKLDFNFNLEIEEEAPAERAAPESASGLPDLDLSGISLDLGAGDAKAPAEEILLTGGESPDVDTKLDLVTAYMDMGDTEGARELLQEVLQEGGPQQRERARNMLDSLG